jgi:hypothetical protein
VCENQSLRLYIVLETKGEGAKKASWWTRLMYGGPHNVEGEREREREREREAGALVSLPFRPIQI